LLLDPGVDEQSCVRLKLADDVGRNVALEDPRNVVISAQSLCSVVVQLEDDGARAQHGDDPVLAPQSIHVFCRGIFP
jgi:hypothetical protein